MVNRPHKTCWDQHRNIRHDLLMISSFYTHLDTDILPRASSPHIVTFWWSLQPEKHTSSGMSWFAACILKCVVNQTWTAKTDCMKASSSERQLHLPKTILVKDAQPPYHTWLPWCNSQRCHVFRKKWQLFLRIVQYWLQRRGIRIRHFVREIIVLFPFLASLA